MAKHLIVSAGPNVLLSINEPGSAKWEMLSKTEWKVYCSDGTYAVFKGVDGETVTSFKHYSEKGLVIDQASGFSMTAETMDYAVYKSFWQFGPFAGNDVIKSKGAVDDQIFSAGGNDKVDSGSGNDQVWGGEGNDSLKGGKGNDLLQGDAPIEFGLGWKGNDKLYGESGNDVLAGSWGDDLLNGGKGIDLAVFERSFNDLKIIQVKGGFTVYSDEGADALRSIEYIQASDGTFGWDAASNSWQQVKDDFWGV